MPLNGRAPYAMTKILKTHPFPANVFTLYDRRYSWSWPAVFPLDFFEFEFLSVLFLVSSRAIANEPSPAFHFDKSDTNLPQNYVILLKIQSEKSNRFSQITD